jgi:integrase
VDQGAEGDAVIKTVERADGKRHQVYGKRAGKKIYLGTLTSRREALAVDEDHRAKQRRIAAGELPSDHDERRTFGTAVERWDKMLRDGGSRSAVAYESRVRLHILPTFRDVPITEIRKADVVRWRDELSLKVAAAYVNSMLGTLSSAFTWFVDQRWVEANPCRRVKPLVRPAKVFPWLQSSEQVTRLLGECALHIRRLVAVLVGTGMRLDEALHLHWDDIDLEHRIITVRRGRKGMPKSGRMRRVPVFDSVMPVLKEMRLTRGANVMLWPGRSKRAPNLALTQAGIWKQFKAAVISAGLSQKMRIHDLRHSFASLFLLDGGDIFKLSRILGHSSVTITEKTYAHLRPDAYEGDYGRVRFRMPSEPASPAHLHQHGDRRA